ncbi:MAG: site-specific integrase [bacterium]|nr:site-specific integrase [bacterium]
MSHVQHRPERAKPWTARYRTPAGRERCKSFKRKVDAERHLTQIDADLLHSDWIDPRHGSKTLQEWWEEWWPTVTSLRASTQARDESYYRNHIEPGFGEMPLFSIEHRAIQKWVSDLSDRRAPETVHKAHQILSKTLRAAVDTRLLKANPCTKTDLPKIETKEMRFLTPPEIDHLAFEIDERYRAFVYLGAYGGLRPGELLGLRHKRIDVSGRQIEVAETLVEVRGELHFNPPKTKAGRRVVPVPGFVTQMLDEHAERHGDGPDDLVFTTPTGQPTRLGLFRQRKWYPAVERAGLAPLRIHDLRHTAVSLWIAAGANPVEVKERAGHASVATVLDRYGHLFPADRDKVTDALEAMANPAA